jgi:hypothetical protein
MAEVERALASTAYALFALEQSLPLDDIAAGAGAMKLPAASAQSPAWFAAAVEGSDLLAMAPELQVLADYEDDVSSESLGHDLISVYAPDKTASEPDRPENEPDDAEEPKQAATQPGTAIQIGLLKELDGLDE